MSGKAKLCVRTHHSVFTGVNMYVNRKEGGSVCYGRTKYCVS